MIGKYPELQKEHLYSTDCDQCKKQHKNLLNTDHNKIHINLYPAKCSTGTQVALQYRNSWFATNAEADVIKYGLA